MDIKTNTYKYLLATMLLIGLGLHKPQLSLDIQGIHTWRQSQTMWNIRNFHRHDANILNPRISALNNDGNNIYRYEFPIMQWVVAQVQHVTSEDILFVRLSMFGIGALGLIGFFCLIRFLFNDPWIGLISTWVMMFSPLLYYFIINPLPDLLALSVSIWYLYFILKYQNTTKKNHLIWASICLLIATCAKLPYLMFSIVSVYFFFTQLRKKETSNFITLKDAGIQLLIITPALAWYAWVIPTWNNGVLTGIFDNEINWLETLDIASYHWTTMFPKILLSPITLILFLIGVIRLPFAKFEKGWLMVLILITFSYLGLEFNMIEKVHDYYMQPFLPWIYVIVAIGVSTLLQSKTAITKVLLGVLCLALPVMTVIEAQEKWGVEQTYFNPDVLQNRTELQSIVPQNVPCIILNDGSGHIFSYQIDKMGYIMANDHLPNAWIHDLIENYDVRYMYSDSRKVDSRVDVVPYLDSLLLQKGSVKVWRLALPETQNIEK